LPLGEQIATDWLVIFKKWQPLLQVCLIFSLLRRVVGGGLQGLPLAWVASAY
jgi:hypothetical protein